MTFVLIPRFGSLYLMEVRVTVAFGHPFILQGGQVISAPFTDGLLSRLVFGTLERCILLVFVPFADFLRHRVPIGIDTFVDVLCNVIPRFEPGTERTMPGNVGIYLFGVLEQLIVGKLLVDSHLSGKLKTERSIAISLLHSLDSIFCQFFSLEFLWIHTQAHRPVAMDFVYIHIIRYTEDCVHYYLLGRRYAYQRSVLIPHFKSTVKPARRSTLFVKCLLILINISQSTFMFIGIATTFSLSTTIHGCGAISTFPFCAKIILVFHGEIFLVEGETPPLNQYSFPFRETEYKELHFFTALNCKPEQHEQAHDRKNEYEMVHPHRIEHMSDTECIGNDACQGYQRHRPNFDKQQQGNQAQPEIECRKCCQTRHVKIKHNVSL